MTIDYGTDVAGFDDLDPVGTEITGPRVVAEACARRLITPRGGLCDDRNYGYDLTQYIDDEFDAPQIARVSSGIVAELIKDERVLSVSVVSVFSAGGLLTVACKVTGTKGPFQFVLTVGARAAQLAVT